MTDDESRPALKSRATRRAAIKVLAAMPLLTLASGKALAAKTPSSTEGPYYPTPRMRKDDTDNDLVKIEGSVREAGGQVLMLRGRVLDRDGRPASGARVEIWQCDVRGRYLHTYDISFRWRDPGFQGFGHDIAGADGTYSFRTIVPVTYPGRTPHIHVKVFHQDVELTSQFYVDGHEGNQRDGIFGRLSPEERRAVSMVMKPEGEAVATSVDVLM